MTRYIQLGVNIDHVATLRQARGTRYPDPIEAAFIAENSGADNITVHLREDRRHIQDRDVKILSSVLQTRMNLEMADTDEMLELACKLHPQDCCLVPENRAELTTEGGMDVSTKLDSLRQICRQLSSEGIRVAVFIDPEEEQIDAAASLQIPVVELHTGRYADASDAHIRAQELHRLGQAALAAQKRGLEVHAGHGLDYHNVVPIAAIPAINELNIGHSIISRALVCGLAMAVKEMKGLIENAASI